MSKFAKKKVDLPPPPRELPAIEAEHGELCKRAGHLQYQVEIFKEELNQLNRQIYQLNAEAHARNTQTKPEVKEVQDVQS